MNKSSLPDIYIFKSLADYRKTYLQPMFLTVNQTDSYKTNQPSCKS